MTSRDKMPFGKYKDTPLAQVPEDYLDWLEEQDWLPTKWPKLYEWLTKGETEETTTELERKNISGEAELFVGMPPAFIAFWKRCYGERMRIHGELNYIAFLRVAVTTWKEATKSEAFKPLPKPATLPPPLAHIPAPHLPDVLAESLGSASDADIEPPLF